MQYIDKESYPRLSETPPILCIKHVSKFRSNFWHILDVAHSSNLYFGTHQKNVIFIEPNSSTKKKLVCISLFFHVNLASIVCLQYKKRRFFFSQINMKCIVPLQKALFSNWNFFNVRPKDSPLSAWWDLNWGRPLKS